MAFALSASGVWSSSQPATPVSSAKHTNSRPRPVHLKAFAPIYQPAPLKSGDLVASSTYQVCTAASTLSSSLFIFVAEACQCDHHSTSIQEALVHGSTYHEAFFVSYKFDIWTEKVIFNLKDLVLNFF